MNNYLERIKYIYIYTSHRKIVINFKQGIVPPLKLAKAKKNFFQRRTTTRFVCRTCSRIVTSRRELWAWRGPAI